MPDVAFTRDRGAGGYQDRIVGRVSAIGIALAGLLDRKVDFGQAEPGQLDLEVEIDQRLQLDCQDFLISAGIEREHVVRNHIRAAFGLGEVREGDRRHRLPLQELCCLDPPMTGDDLAIMGDEDWVGEPKPLDRRCDLPDLLFGMRPRVARERAERRDRPIYNLRTAHLDLPNQLDRRCAHRLNACNRQSSAYAAGILD